MDDKPLPTWIIGLTAFIAIGICCTGLFLLTVNDPRLARVIDSAIPKVPPTATSTATRPPTVTPLALPTFTPLPTRWPTATPRPVPANVGPRPTTAGDLSPDEREYVSAVAAQTLRIAQGLNGISILSQNAQFGNRDWESGMNVSLILVRDAYRILSELSPPSSMYQYHQALLDATSDCDSGARFLGEGVDNQSESDIRRAGELIQSCGSKMESLNR